jgi:hypothetical protein
VNVTALGARTELAQGTKSRSVVQWRFGGGYGDWPGLFV